MPQNVVIKKSPAAGAKKPAAPADRKPKAAPKPKSTNPNPNAIDLGLDDEGPQDIPVRFLRDDEVWYNAHLPKGTLALALGQEMQEVDQTDLDEMRRMIDKFTRLLFNGEDQAAIMLRLDDPDDRLDLMHIKVLIQRIAQRTAGLPTT